MEPSATRALARFHRRAIGDAVAARRSVAADCACRRGLRRTTSTSARDRRAPPSARSRRRADDRDGRPAAQPDRPRPSGRSRRRADRPDDPAGRDPAEPADPEKRETAAGAEDAYRAYVDAINERDGEALCSLLAPDAVRGLRPPVDRGSCARSLTASIGYEDPRGFPVWERTVLNGIESVSVGDDPGTVRLTAATLTEFADRAEPSVESDIAYLELAAALAPRAADRRDLPGDRAAGAASERDRSPAGVTPRATDYRLTETIEPEPPRATTVT